MVIMERLFYTPPTTEVQPLLLESACLIATSNDPYDDNGDYDWGA
jgi:hypothetical protein